MGFIADAVVYGVGDAMSLVREQDPDALLAAQAIVERTAIAATEKFKHEADYLAQRIVAELANALK